MPYTFYQFLRGPILFIISIAISPSLYAQCNPPGQLPSTDCSTAEVICFVDECYRLTNIPNSGPLNWCGQNAEIDNPQYFKFIAGDENVLIQIHVDGCLSGQGIQAGLLAACPWELSDVLDCHTGQVPGGNLELSFAGMIPGQMYWLVVDGYLGAICDYTITYGEGMEMVEISGELSVAETMVIPQMLCRGYNNAHFITGPGLPDANGYYWVFSWSNDTVTTAVNELYHDIPDDVPAGEYSFCVAAFSGCDATSEICQTFIVLPSDTIYKESVLCSEVFPFMWGNSIISGPGTYREPFGDTFGCTDTIWMIDVYPAQPIDTITHIFCDAGMEPGVYTLTYPNADIYGCDSIALLNIVVGNISSLIALECENGEFVLYPVIEELGIPDDELSYEWYNCDFATLLSDGHVFYTILSGCYCVITTGLYCQDTACISFDGKAEVIIQQIGDSLCVEAGDFVSVKWHDCADTISLGSEFCFKPAGEGCYCIEVSDANSCIQSDCYEFISNTLDATEAGFACFPNPSSDAVSLLLPDHINLPVDWMLYDGTGKSVGTGRIEEHESQFIWPEKVMPGNYEMMIRSGDKVFRLGLVRMEK